MTLSSKIQRAIDDSLTDGSLELRETLNEILMKAHTRIYMNHFNYGLDDFIPCEACGRNAVDIHHVQGRGKDKDVIENLMALCRKCHEKAHNELSKSDVQYIHNSFLAGKRNKFLK